MILLDWTLWQRAVCAFRKSLRLYAKCMIEPRPVVLPCDGGGQFYHLRLIEIFSQPGEQLIRHFDWRHGHPNSVVEDELLHCREGIAPPVARKLAELFFTDPVSSAHGRADIDSPGTADHGGHFYQGEFFQPRVNLLLSFESHLEGPRAEQNP